MQQLGEILMVKLLKGAPCSPIPLVMGSLEQFLDAIASLAPILVNSLLGQSVGQSVRANVMAKWGGQPYKR